MIYPHLPSFTYIYHHLPTFTIIYPTFSIVFPQFSMIRVPLLKASLREAGKPLAPMAQWPNGRLGGGCFSSAARAAWDPPGDSWGLMIEINKQINR
jgi:hypothetical protein